MKPPGDSRRHSHITLPIFAVPEQDHALLIALAVRVVGVGFRREHVKDR
jgi:hypothetical protein